MSTQAEFLNQIITNGFPGLVPVMALLAWFAWLSHSRYGKLRLLAAVEDDTRRVHVSLPPNLTPPELQGIRPGTAADTADSLPVLGFERRRILQRPEYSLLPVLERIVFDLDRGHSVLTQTSLGDLIQPCASEGTDHLREKALASIRARSVDYAIVDRSGLPVLALEFVGGGEAPRRMVTRDRLKRHALRQANVPVLEVGARWSPEDLTRSIRAHLADPAGPTPQERRIIQDMFSGPDSPFAHSGLPST